jgi:hypothetical protein
LLISRLSVLIPDVDACPKERSDRVRRHRGHRTDLNVARRCHLEMDLMVEHVLRERAEDQLAVVADVGVGRQTNSVADPVGAVGERIGDQLQVGWLAGVDRDVEVRRAGEGQRVGVE